MKIAHLSIGLLALFSPLTAAWSKEDREIFRIRDEIAAHEADSAATFYDILGITQSASQEDITKAFRQKTRTLHPDKVKQKLKADRAKNKDKDAKPPSPSEVKAAVKEAEERQTRLSLIAKILRGPGRDRYNHFLENGFPLWKGTDYYYDRYRPGLGTAITGVLLLCGGAVHYLILYMNWKRQREFVERYIRFARDTAWGPNMNVPGVDSAPAPTPAPAASQADDEDGPPQPMNRKQRRMQEKETKRDDGRGARKKARKAKSASSSRDASAAPTGARKRVVAENGKILVVDSLGNVYLEDQDEEGNVNELLLDAEELVVPSFKDTAIVSLPLWVLRSTFGRLLSKPAQEEVDIVADEDQDSDSPQRTPSSDSADEDFELLDKSTASLKKATKATGAQQAGKANKRKGKKR